MFESEHFRTFVEHANDSILLLQNGKLVYWNPAFVRLLGCSDSEIAGHHFLSLIAPEDRRHTRDVYERRLRGEAVPAVYEVDLLAADGSRVTVEVKPCVICVQGRPSTLVVLRDVMDRKRALEELYAAKEYAENLVNSSRDMIVSIDQAGRITAFNGAAEQAFGYAKENVLGRPVEMLYVDPAERLRVQESLAATGQFSGEITNRRRDGSTFVAHLSASVVRNGQGKAIGVMGVSRDITAQKHAEAALREAHRQTALLLAAIPSILIGLDPQFRISWWNTAAEQTFGMTADEAMGRPLSDCGSVWAAGVLSEGLLRSRSTGDVVRLDDLPFQTAMGGERLVGITINPMQDEAGRLHGFLVLGADVTERRHLERQLTQAQKLESIGQLAAGIAHEINTPTQYIGDNTRFLQDAFGDLAELIHQYTALGQAVRRGRPVEALLQEIETRAQAIDVTYLLEEIPNAIVQSLEGIERVSTIVRAMKAFSHPGGEDMTPLDLNSAIENTITVARNEWKYVADVVTDFDPTLPPVPCFPGELNQVILNMIVNAAHAVADTVETSGRGIITLTTCQHDNWAEIRIADTGTGIPENIRHKIFDPFFTTKEVGKGTGQGLAIAHDVIVKKHGGTIAFDTVMGQGTTFTLRIPLKPDAT